MNERAPIASAASAATSLTAMWSELIAILKSERRPTIATNREVLGGGSPDTIGNALQRLWRDLGARVEGDPAALSRMPSEIAGLADGMWQRAQALAGEAAKSNDNAAHERLNQLQLETEIRQRSFELREQEIDTQARQRETALAEARDHLLALSKALAREEATHEAHQARVRSLERQMLSIKLKLPRWLRARQSGSVLGLRRSRPTQKRSGQKARHSPLAGTLR